MVLKLFKTSQPKLSLLFTIAFRRVFRLKNNFIKRFIFIFTIKSHPNLIKFQDTYQLVNVYLIKYYSI